MPVLQPALPSVHAVGSQLPAIITSVESREALLVYG